MTDRSLSLAVVEAVATREGVPVSDLPPLAEVVDPDALDGLFAPSLGGTTRLGGRVTFEYCGYHVVVNASGDVTVEE